METMNELSEEEILGGAVAESEVGQAALANYSAAKEALARSDAAELFVLYQKAIRDRNETIDAFSKLARHYMGENSTPRYAESESSVTAIRDVALAAIEFARAKTV